MLVKLLCLRSVWSLVVCLLVLVIVCGVPTARLCAVEDDNNKDMRVNHR